MVQEKYEQRTPSGDIFDDYVSFLSAELLDGVRCRNMEVSYTKEQQKQKQKQQNKNKDSDVSEVFDESRQVALEAEMEDYFEYTLEQGGDLIKKALALAIPFPIVKLAYTLPSGASTSWINVYPTLQFLYSKHIKSDYITPEVKKFVFSRDSGDAFQSSFQEFFRLIKNSEVGDCFGGRTNGGSECNGPNKRLQVKVSVNHIQQSPLYTLAAIRKGVYVIGMKDQFNVHDMRAGGPESSNSNPLTPHIAYVADEAGFVLYDATAAKSVDTFGPYFVEQYLLMEVLSKHEVAQNVIEYYVDHKEKLQSALDQYNEEQGKGFICWRFINDPVRKIHNAKDGGNLDRSRF